MTDNANPLRELETALRWMATRKHAPPLGLLTHALETQDGDSAIILAPLTEPTASLPNGTVATRALAAWGLIIHEIRRIGSTDDSRRRNTLAAAFRLRRRPEIAEPWKSTLDDRFKQLLALPGVFGDPPPSTTTPMHKAWRSGLTEKLGPALHRRLGQLAADGSGWEFYVAVATQVDAEHGGAATTTEAHPVVGYRRPSEGAQPLFMQLFVTTVFMRRTVYRRITERLVVAQEDDVDGYTATALVGAATDTANLPVRALWGCRAAPVPMAHADDMRLTRLVFPTPLRRGEKHLFSSEAIDERIEERRRWVNVEIDHHGIAPGRILDGGLPVSGLTIRIRFDEDYLPEACWWYAERTERQRAERPSLGDPRLLTVVDGAVHHTFSQPCHPRDSYGIFLSWPDR